MKRFGMFAIAALIGLFSFSPAHSQIVNPTNANNVLYTAPYTGAVARTQSNKNAESVTPKDFGASCNLVADDTTKIQAALNTGKRVSLGGCTALVTSTLTLASNQEITGPGTLQRNTAGNIITATSKTNVRVSDITFIGDVDSWAIKLVNVKQAIINNNNAQEIMLLHTDSSESVYANVNANNMSGDIVVSNNTGTVSLTPAAQSQQFIRIVYTYNFAITGNQANGYRELALAWGGDSATDQAAANERKCWNGSISGNSANTLGAGIWVSMGRDISVTGNALTGTFANSLEGIGTEAGYRITFAGNSIYNYGIGAYVRSLYADINFIGNTITQPGGASSYLFYNESNDFYADIGDINFIGNEVKATGALAGFYPGTVRIFNMRDNTVTNAYPQFVSNAGVGGIEFINNNIFSQYAPAAPANTTFALVFGSIVNGYTIQPQIASVRVKNNRLEYNTGVISSKRAIGIGLGNGYDARYEIEGNTILGFNEVFTLENAGVNTVYNIIKNNIIDASATYPQVYYAGTHTVLWQDNYNTSGVDAYNGVAGFAAVPYFSPGSRIWARAPASLATPCWINTVAGQSGTWTACANLQ